VVSRPDALIHKASITIQIDRLDAHPPGPDARASDMEIACSGGVTVQTIVHLQPDAALKQERSLAKVLKFRSYNCPSGLPMTTVRTAPSFIKLNAHLNC
jgi:hypothetical protein